MGYRLATIDMGRKVRGCWVPINTMWTGPRPTSVPNGILIHPTVWPQYTNVTDRQIGQRDRTTVP